MNLDLLRTDWQKHNTLADKQITNQPNCIEQTSFHIRNLSNLPMKFQFDRPLKTGDMFQKHTNKKYRHIGGQTHTFFEFYCCTLLEAFKLNSLVKTEPKSAKNSSRYREKNTLTKMTHWRTNRSQIHQIHLKSFYSHCRVSMCQILGPSAHKLLRNI